MSNELKLLNKVDEYLKQGISELDVIDLIEDELFEYLNVLEAFYIHAGRYDVDMIIARAKDEVDVDLGLVKELLAEIETDDEKSLTAFIENRIKRLS